MSPVTNDTTIRIALMIMVKHVNFIVELKGAFLHGELDPNQVISFNVPQGFEEFYDPNKYYLQLQQTKSWQL